MTEQQLTTLYIATIWQARHHEQDKRNRERKAAYELKTELGR